MSAFFYFLVPETGLESATSGKSYSEKYEQTFTFIGHLSTARLGNFIVDDLRQATWRMIALCHWSQGCS